MGNSVGCILDRAMLIERPIDHRLSAEVTRAARKRRELNAEIACSMWFREAVHRRGQNDLQPRSP